ncbi:MAG: glycine betaine ABC transporter substrate-binding protein [Actinocatenispora sp.]
MKAVPEKGNNVRHWKAWRTAVVGVAIAATLSMTVGACGKRQEGSSSSGKNITVGVLQGWAEDQVATELWKQVLTDKGYHVTIKKLPDAGPMFTGLKGGDIDLFLDTWLPITHKKFVDKYKGSFEDLGVWYDNAKLTIAVPKYVKVDSIADLKGKGGTFNKQIVGIEPGAGLTAATKKAIKGYGLSSDYTLRTSSTAGMLSQLKKQTDAKKPVVVTLWRPHWAYTQYPVKDLADPKGLMGATEKIHGYATKGFGSDHPDLAKWMKNFKMDDQQLGTLEDLALNQGSDDPAQGVSKWMKQNKDYVKSMTS